MKRDYLELNKKAQIFIISKYKKFKCQSCRKVFKERSNLITHIKIHSGVKKFQCTFEGCSKKFITLGNLKAHQDFHSKFKPYGCPEINCPERYSKQSRLLIHMRTHTGDKPYKCYCGKAFNERGNLKTHMRIHTGERPFVCKFPGCEASFKAHGHLKDHQKMHTNERPYLCRECGKSFGRSGILKNHMRIHLRSKMYCKTTNQESVTTPKSSGINEDKPKNNENDGEVTISCGSNLNEDDTPINKQMIMNEFNSKIKVTSFSYEINKNGLAYCPSTQLTLNIQNPLNGNENIKDPKIMPNQFLNEINEINLDETITKTPISKIEKCMEKGVATFSNNFYIECLNHYLNIYRNDIKYSKFSDLFNLFIQNETKNGNEISLNTLKNFIEKMKVQEGIKDQINSPIVGNSPMTIANQSVLINNNFELGNLSNFISPKSSNLIPQYLLEKSPKYYHNNYTTFSPIEYTNNFNRNNNNNSINPAQGNESFSVPRYVPHQKVMVNFSCLAENFKNQ